MATKLGKSLSVCYKDKDEKKRTQNITQINPDATDTSIAEFGQLMTDLQEDAVVEMILVEKKSITI